MIFAGPPPLRERTVFPSRDFQRTVPVLEKMGNSANLRERKFDTMAVVSYPVYLP